MPAAGLAGARNAPGRPARTRRPGGVSGLMGPERSASAWAPADHGRHTVHVPDRSRFRFRFRRFGRRLGGPAVQAAVYGAATAAGSGAVELAVRVLAHR